MTLTADRLRELLHYDPATGVFTWRKSAGSRAAGAAVGCPNAKGYLRVRLDKELFLLHRLVFLYVGGAWPAGHVDHINGVVDDNRLLNLRDVTRECNMQNRRSARKGSASGLIGAMKATNGRWRAVIRVAGRYAHLGYFDTPEAAHAAYIAAKRQNHEGNTL